MPSVSSNTDFMPKMLPLVNRILNECGMESTATLASPNVRVAAVVNGLNDCCMEIFRTNRWPWAKREGFLKLKPNQSEYPLPNDFYRAAGQLTIPGKPIKLDEKQPSEFEDLMFRGMEGVGVPYVYTIDRNSFCLYPPPSSDFISQYPTLRFLYYRQPPNRVEGDTDSLELPAEFLTTVVHYGKWRLKDHLEWPDAANDQKMYLTALDNRMNEVRQTQTMFRIQDEAHTGYY